MENLLSVSGLFSNIVLRVNLNKENKNSVYDLFNALKSSDRKNISVYPAPIQNTNNCYDCDLCFANKDFLKFEYEYIKAAYGESFIQKKYPVLRGNVCCADRVNAYVIDADGEMYKCWTDIGDKRLSMGNIVDGVSNKMNELEYLKNDPTRDSKCKDCKFLPVCLGGCPHQVKKRVDDRCIYFEEIFKLYLIDTVKGFELVADRNKA